MKVVITGIGAVTPIGIGVDGLWEGVLREQSAVRRLTHFDASGFSSQIAAEVGDFCPEKYIEPKRLKRLDRYAQIALVCGAMALEDAGIHPGSISPNRMGATVGTALGGIGKAETEYPNFLKGGLRAVDPSLALSVFGGAGSCNLAIALGITGYNTANSDSCASGPIAIGNAVNAIRRGDADVMLAGAAEAPLFPLTFGAFALIRAMSTRNDNPAAACRPFDKDRDGFVMGEGGAMLVLESEEHAKARGAQVYGELAGFGLSNDAFHMTAPRTDGSQAARAMSLAMTDAGISAEQITYISAHASSTPLNDASETLAIKTVLGDRAHQVPISGTKAMHAHALGATGAMEAAICALCLKHGWVPPTVNLEEPSEGLDLDYVPGHGRNVDHEAILSNSFGFGGINAALVFKPN